MQNYQILVCEDEVEIGNAIEIYLKNQGYGVHRAYNGKEGLEILSRQTIHLAIVDLMMPVMDGLTMIMTLRQSYDFPVIVLSAKSEDMDKITGLNMGADDYITKPFTPMELLARVESVLRRTGRKNSVLKFQNLTIDEDQRQVYGPAGVIELTPKEFDLFVFLIRNRNIALYREEILEKVWHDDYEGTTRTVDMHVASLRKKLRLSKQIVSVYKIGYRLEDRS